MAEGTAQQGENREVALELRAIVPSTGRDAAGMQGAGARTLLRGAPGLLPTNRWGEKCRSVVNTKAKRKRSCEQAKYLVSRGRCGSNPLVELVFRQESMGSKGRCEAHPLLAPGVSLPFSCKVWEVHWDTFTARWRSPTKPPEMQRFPSAWRWEKALTHWQSRAARVLGVAQHPAALLRDGPQLCCGGASFKQM